jgi:integrase
VAAGAAVFKGTIMNLPDSDVPSALALDRLIDAAAQELLMRSYTRRTLDRYKRVWERLAEFAQSQGGADEFSRELALRFEEAYGLRAGEKLRKGERWRLHLVYGIKVLDDLARTGTITRFAVETTGLHIPQGMHKPLREYEQYAREQRYLRRSSLAERMRCIAVFLDFLRARGLDSLNRLQAEDISALIQPLSLWKPKTASRAASHLRQFLRFLFMRDVLPRDLGTALPTIRRVSQDTVPSVWDPELVTRLLDAVDRSSPKGKRDYAILLLASRLGLRLSDIKNLKLDDLQWTTASINIEQTKTGAPLELPMSEEVGTALIDYLRAGRPAANHRQVFLSLTPPFAPFCERDHLYRVVNHWRALAGIEFRTPQRQGLHSLRHTLATRLLRAETPFPVISAILGHASPASTFIYAKADVETLRIAALDPEESCHAQRDSNDRRSQSAGSLDGDIPPGDARLWLPRYVSRRHPASVRCLSIPARATAVRAAKVAQLAMAGQATAREREHPTQPNLGRAPVRDVPVQDGASCRRSRPGHGSKGDDRIRPTHPDA